MKFEEFTAAEQQLMNTQFDEGTEKVAQEKLATAAEMYQYGENMAENMADEYDEMVKVAAEEAEEEEKEEKKEEKEEENKSDEEKTASANIYAIAEEYGSFVEKGVSDTLEKLGSERRGDDMFYIMPYLEEKVAQAGAKAALEKFAAKMSGLKKLTSAAGDVLTGAKREGRKMVDSVKSTGRLAKDVSTGKIKGTKLKGSKMKQARREAIGGLAAKGAAGAGALGGAALLGSQLSKNKNK